MKRSQPPELVVTLAALPGRNVYVADGGWLHADQVRAQLRLFGFDATAQQLAAWLGRMSRVDAPWVERRRDFAGYWQYRVTPYGRTDIENNLPALRVIR